MDELLSQSNTKNNMSFDQVAVHVLVHGYTLFKIQMYTKDLQIYTFKM